MTTPDRIALIVAAPSTFSSSEAQRRWNVSEAQRRWNVSEEFADEILRGFVDAGFVLNVESDAYAVTALGREWSELLTDVASDYLEVA